MEEDVGLYVALGVDVGRVDVLTLSRGALASLYRRAALKWHPDRNKSKEAEEQFGKIFRAYEILSDEKKRKEYDDKIRAARERRKRYESMDRERRELKQRLEEREGEKEEERREDGVEDEVERLRREVGREEREEWKQGGRWREVRGFEEFRRGGKFEDFEQAILQGRFAE